jgi:transposase
MRRNLFWGSDEQWRRIEPHLPTDVRGVERADDRRVISGIVHVLKSGCRWCDCPPEYGPPTTIYNRFVRWARRGRLGKPVAGRHTDDRFHAHQGASLGFGRKTYGPPRRQVVFEAGISSLHKRIRPFGYAIGQDGRSARSAPHKGDGIEVPFSAVDLQNADRLSGHLSHHPQTSLIGHQRKPVDLESSNDCSRLKGCAVPQERPDDARHFGGERHNHSIGMRSRK